MFILGFLKEGEYQMCLLSGGSDKVLQTKFALKDSKVPTDLPKEH